MLFFRFLSKLPLSILYILSDVLYLVMRYGFRYRVEIARNNITNSFPNKSEGEVEVILNKFYSNLADLIIESIKLLSISKDELNQRVSVKNLEVVLKHFENQTSMLLVACHQFNWEWMVTAGRTHTPYAFTSVYRPLNNKFFDHLMIAVRTRFKGKLISNKQLIDDLTENAEVAAYSMVMDHVSSKHHYWTTFLNQDTVFDTSIDFHTQSFQLPAIYPKLKKLKRGYYCIELIPLGEPPYCEPATLLPKFINEIEQSILEQPETYLWTHRRWKYEKPELKNF